MTESEIDIRPLRRYDVGQYLRFLAQLSDVGDDWTGAKREAVFDEIDNNSAFQRIYVAVDSNNRVLGAITLLLERKFLHGGAIAAHIEDVVVDSSARGRGLGRRLVEHAVRGAKKAGAYKVILNCKKDLRAFYGQCGFGYCNKVQLRL